MNNSAIASTLLLGSAVFSGCQSVQQDQKPNIIIFFTDDQGYADLGCFGAEGFQTPEIDALAAQGIRCTDFYVPATVSTPSRAGLLTGQYPIRSGLHEAVIFPFSEHGLKQEKYTLAEMLRDNGYDCSLIGKWHLGHQEEFMPWNHGFDYFFGVPYSNDMDNYHYKHNDFQSPPLPLYKNREIIESGPDQQYLTQRYTREALKIIRSKKEKPFFIYLAHNMPHRPLHASPDFQGKSELGLYGDVIMELDWSAGEIVSALKEEGIFNNTLMIYTSDNGPDVGSAKPLRGRKAHTWDGGQRVPAIITWPDYIPANQVCEEMILSTDIFPSLAQIIHAELPEGLKFDGQNISDLLKNPSGTRLDDRPFFYYSRDGFIEAVRYGHWKLHIAKSRGWSVKNQGAFPVSLYDLKTDIGEQNNLAEQYPDIVEKLSGFIDTQRADINDLDE